MKVEIPQIVYEIVISSKNLKRASTIFFLFLTLDVRIFKINLTTNEKYFL